MTSLTRPYLHVGEDGVWWAGVHLVRRQDLVSGFVVPRLRGVCRVRLIGPGGQRRFEVNLPTEERARAFLHALRLDASAPAKPPRMRGATVWVGSDGLLLQRRNGDRFLPYAALGNASVEDRELVLAVVGGEDLRLHARGSTRVAGDVCRALCDRIKAGMELIEAASSRRASAVSLLRGARSVKEWLSELRALGREDEPLRSSGTAPVRGPEAIGP